MSRSSHRSGPTPLLQVRDLRVCFPTARGDLWAVDGVDLTAYRGEILALVGESGCGKSTTALSILRLLPSTARLTGSIRLLDAELTSLPRRGIEDIRGARIAMIFQDPMSSLNPTMTVGEQLAEPMHRHLGLTRGVARERAISLLQRVQVSDAAARSRAYPHEFSGGQRQRIMIAMALSCRPELLIADEPTTALDVTTQAEILALIGELIAELDMGMILVTHDMGVVAETADTVAVMYAGQVIESAPVRELFTNPCHPYTGALLDAVPDVNDGQSRTRRLASVPGRPPDLSVPQQRCRFAPRCPLAGRADGCATHPQELREVGRDHWVRTAHRMDDAS